MKCKALCLLVHAAALALRDSDCERVELLLHLINILHGLHLLLCELALALVSILRPLLAIQQSFPVLIQL